MFLELTPQCLDEWTASYDALFRALMQYAQPLTKACGYSFEYDSHALRAAHADWVSDCQSWHSTRLMPDSNGLSHLKMLALLIHHLAQAPWVSNLFEFDIEGTREYEFNGPEEIRLEVRKDINAGRGAYLGYQFCIFVINFFERWRIDKQQEFVFRMTDDMEHNLLVYILSDSRDPIAIYLILKALYIRDNI